jgi:hypothetical protein
MLQIIHNQHGYHVINVTLGAIINTFQTEQEAINLKHKILN